MTVKVHAGTTLQSGRITWTAGREGLAHAHRGSRPVRALCGAPAIDPRLGWPTRVRCDACLAAIAGEPTESENRALWGDR